MGVFEDTSSTRHAGIDLVTFADSFDTPARVLEAAGLASAPRLSETDILSASSAVFQILATRLPHCRRSPALTRHASRRLVRGMLHAGRVAWDEVQPGAFQVAQMCLQRSPINDPESRRSLWNVSRLGSLRPAVLRHGCSAGDFCVDSDVQEHYERLLVLSRPLRGLPAYTMHNYSGPWTEDVWISRFMQAPLDSFGGLVPLFVGWVNSRYEPRYGELVRQLLRELRPDLLYVTVSWSDEGLHYWFRPEDLPNLLIMSSGGSGHIPLPLLFREQPPQRNPTRTKKHLVGFVGDALAHPLRAEVATSLEHFSPTTAHYPRTRRWQELLRRVGVVACPRGLGRTSFRLYEVLQLGMVPVHVWDDCEWLPYKNTRADVRRLGWSVHVSRFRAWLRSLLEAPPTEAELARRRGEILALRESHFTTEGLGQQIAWFFAGDARSDLQCVPCPVASNDQIAHWFLARDSLGHAQRHG